MPLASWLFVNGTQSIWVERPRGLVMVVAGPGTNREEREFLSEQALDAYQIALAERLSAEGWFLWGVNRERRERADRRGSTRGTADRRRVPVDNGPHAGLGRT